MPRKKIPLDQYPESKVCLGKCGLELPLGAFEEARGGRFGRRARCKKCRAEESKDRQLRTPLTEELKARRKKTHLAASKKYRQTNKGRAAKKRAGSSESSKRANRKYNRSERGKVSLREASRRLTSKRRAWMQAEKVRRGCIDCGYNKHPAALDFDHIGGDKLFEVSKTMSRRLSVMKAEIAKCVVRCSNCHRIKTYEARQVAEDKRRIKGVK